LLPTLLPYCSLTDKDFGAAQQAARLFKVGQARIAGSDAILLS
jgi:hypothetical protein